MSTSAKIILLSSLAGLAMPAGALLALVERIRPQWLETEFRHSVIAFGGGALLSAVALVLVPEGARHFAPFWAAGIFLAGGLSFLFLDRFIARSKGSAAQLIAMLADFFPEALAMGAGFATGESTGEILALLIALQNLPEGFNACRELGASTDMSGRSIVASFAGLALLGPIAALVGFFWLAGLAEAVAAIMLFSAGGILYLTFQDIAPQAKLSNRHAPALGAVVGFACGMVGQMLVGHG